jgi:hypothetical protein
MRKAPFTAGLIIRSISEICNCMENKPHRKEKYESITDQFNRIMMGGDDDD